MAKRGCGCGCPGCVVLLALFLAALVAGAIWLRQRLGGVTQPYADLLAASTPLVSADALEVIVTSDEPIGNVAVSAEGRIFYTIHPESRPAGSKLYEWRDGRGRPYPTVEFQSRFITPLGVALDRRGRLWVVDHGLHGARGARLLAFDLVSGALVHEHRFERSVAPLGSFLQDLEVDPAGDTIYLADASFFGRSPALIVYDVVAGRARRVLENHPSVRAQNWRVRTSSREMRFLGGVVGFPVGVDGIAVDPIEGAWLAWGALNHDRLHRISTAALRDQRLAPEALAGAIEDLGPKPLSDGLAVDSEGGILITDVEHGAVARRRPDGALETLLRAPGRVRWADALAFGPDGWLYLADSAIADQVLRSKRYMRTAGPYYIYRFRPPVAGVPGS